MSGCMAVGPDSGVISSCGVVGCTGDGFMVFEARGGHSVRFHTGVCSSRVRTLTLF